MAETKSHATRNGTEDNGARIHLQYAGPALRRLRGQGEYELMNEFQPLIAGETRTSTGRLPSVELYSRLLP